MLCPGAVDPVANRFGSALVLREGTETDKVMEKDKPDDGGGGILDSPVSPLRPRANTSSSSSSSGSAPGRPLPIARSEETSPTAAADGGRVSKNSHRRSGSGQLIFSSRAAFGGGCSSATSPLTNVLPAGNICPSGKITGMVPRTTAARSDVLGSGTGNYGHGSIMRGGRPGGDPATASRGDPSAKRAAAKVDPQEVTRAGNEQYKRGNYGEALLLYDKAVTMCPENAACRSNRAAALAGLGRLGEAVRECEEAVRLDPSSCRAHHRLASLYLRLGQIEDAKQHLFSTGGQLDTRELQKLQTLERHLGICDEARKVADWKSALREADAAIAAGADSSPTIMAAKAEAHLRILQIDEADSVSSNSLRLEKPPFYSDAKVFGMHPGSYIYMIRAQVDMFLGRFENAVELAEKARRMDPRNMELTLIFNNVKSVARARTQGNELFKSGNFAEASEAYGEGLRLDPSNPVLLCNRAACRSKLGQWEKSIEDCNQALKIQPHYIKALLRRADSNAKLERWSESVRDYELLSEKIPADTEVAEALSHAQVALKSSRGGVSNLKFGGYAEEVTSLKQFQAAISLPGTSIIYFMATSNLQCSQISPSVNSLCTHYPSANFFKVDINKSPAVAKSESVRVVPTFKIYKNGIRVKEMICPSQQVLEHSVGHYS
ncbi:TPR repeat-containing thioredoxin TTL1-like [Zingiber officinale]|uniref:TPR repeat-containing thioredoxin TTL1-like n=1 Tax=Zingiber officinale TaxID=94328 RepID=UPI001C4B9D16|nr:TPR repeat-containing thioredoxin TTL1-like [Zingiber officinale]